MHSKSIIALVLMVSFLPTFADKKAVTGSISGHVTDAKTNLGIADARVSIASLNATATTDRVGWFLLDSIKVGYYDIVVSAADHIPQTLPSHSVLSGVNREISIELQPIENIVTLDKMYVSSNRGSTKSTEQSNSVDRIMRDQILTAPGALQDPSRLLQTMPSTVSSPGFGNTFLVRGGADNENQFLVDGIEINNLSHWGSEYGSGGPMSYLHPDFIQSMDFYSGGLPARYPPKLSSVTDITLREGSKSKRLWQVDLNMAGAGALMEGPIVAQKSSYIINARVSFLDILSPFLNYGGLPKYQNGQAKLTFDLNQSNKLNVNIIAGHEEILTSDTAYRNKSTSTGYHGAAGITLISRNECGMNTMLLSGLVNKTDQNSVSHDSITVWRWKNQHVVGQYKDDFTLYLRERDKLSLCAVLEAKDQYSRIGYDEYYLYANLDTDSLYRYSLHRSTVDSPLVSIPLDSIYSSKLGYRIGSISPRGCPSRRSMSQNQNRPLPRVMILTRDGTTNAARRPLSSRYGTIIPSISNMQPCWPTSRSRTSSIRNA
jgi:hypothetical protein